LAGQLDWKQVPLAAHMTANYQHYMKKTVAAHKNKEVLVVRMDKLWDDLKALDRQLGGTGNFGVVEGSAYTHGSESYQSSSTGSSLSDAGAKLLCCALLAELEIYRELLNAAANLHGHDKRETIQAAVERCGWNSWEKMTQACVTQSAASSR
jgi:hypothetical protein